MKPYNELTFRGKILRLRKLWLGRMANFANYAAQVDEADSARGHIKARCEEMEEYLG